MVIFFSPLSGGVKGVLFRSLQRSFAVHLNPVRTFAAQVTVDVRHGFAVALAIMGNHMQSRGPDPKLIYNCVKVIN